MSQTVLVADDSRTIRRAIEMALKASPFGVIAASTLRETVEALGSRPDVLVLDHAMPDGNAYDLCRNLRASEATRQMPVVMMGGASQNFDAEQARQSGADAVLAKPFTVDDLVGAITRAIETRRQLAVPAPALAPAPLAVAPQPGPQAGAVGRTMMMMGPVPIGMMSGVAPARDTPAPLPIVENNSALATQAALEPPVPVPPVAPPAEPAERPFDLAAWANASGHSGAAILRPAPAADAALEGVTNEVPEAALPVPAQPAPAPAPAEELPVPAAVATAPAPPEPVPAPVAEPAPAAPIVVSPSLEQVAPFLHTPPASALAASGLSRAEIEKIMRDEIKATVREELPGLLRSLLGEVFQEKVMPTLVKISENRVQTIVHEEMDKRIETRVRALLEGMLNE